jgi:hypothetical protein
LSSPADFYFNKVGFSTLTLCPVFGVHYNMVGTTASVIEDIEETDYEGDFLTMASRIAAVLHRKVEVRLVPMEATEPAGIAT